MTPYGILFISSFVIALSGAVMPGPLLTATISESARRGVSAGPLIMLGHGLLEAALVALLLLGLAPLLRGSFFISIVSLAGGIILLGLGIGMFRGLPGLTLEAAAAGGRGSVPVPLKGVLLSLANPYWTVWWATIGLAWLLQAERVGPAAVGVFFAGHIAGDFAWYTAVSIAVGKGRMLFSDRIYRGLIGTCAGVLVLFAGLFLVAGARGVSAVLR